MKDLPFTERFINHYLGYQYWFTYQTTTHRLLGIRFSSIVKLAAIALVLALWITSSSSLLLYLSLALLIWIFLAYWLSRRSGYFRFVEMRSDLALENPPQKIPVYKRYPVDASGIFSLEQWERNVLFRPAKYWQVPRGDHAVMVEHEPHRYLYQFFDPSKVHRIERGWLIHGRRPNPAVAISFRSIWGPEFSKVQFSIFGSERKAAEPIDRIIYLSFHDEETEQIVCNNIISDLLLYQESSSNQED